MSIRTAVLLSIIGALVVLAGSFALYAHSPQHDQYAFWSSLLLNVAAGFVGTAVSLGIGVLLARHYARTRTDELAPAVVRLIRDLRQAGTISKPAARSAVVCAVNILANGALNADRADAAHAPEDLCPVCDEKYEVDDRPGREPICADCGLCGSVWKIGDSDRLAGTRS